MTEVVMDKSKLVCLRCGGTRFWGPRKNSENTYGCASCGTTVSVPIYGSCVICGGKFRKRGRKRTCSDECSCILKRQAFKNWYRVNKKVVYRNCVICGASFVRNGPSLTCSEVCSKERQRRYQKEYYEANKKFLQVTSIIYWRLNRIRLIQLLGGVCVWCGFSDLRALEIDHVEGGGRADQVKHGGNGKMCLHYLNHPEIAREKLQVLCSNCNSIKYRESRGV